MPGFNINEATDVLLKRDFDRHRKRGTAHQYLKNLGFDHLVPYQHDNFELWTQSLHFGAEGRFHTVHEETNLKIGGGLDDVWINTRTHQLHIVDYKSTSLKTAGRVVTLDDRWKASYKRQMDIYVWVMRRLGFDTADTGYFLYCDGDRFTDTPFLGSKISTMEFKMYLLAYDVEQGWIEPTLNSIKRTLMLESCPEHSPNCEYGNFLKAVGNV